MKIAPPLALRPCTVTWILVMTLTLASYRLGFGAPGPMLAGAVLLLTLFKSQLVIDHFMGLRHVRPAWRIAMAAYLLSVGATISIAYLIH